MSREDVLGTERSAMLGSASLLPFVGDPTAVEMTAFLNWNHPAHSLVHFTNISGGILSARSCAGCWSHRDELGTDPSLKDFSS